MICILPQTQRREDKVCLFYQAVAITSVLWFVILSQSEKAVPFFPCRRYRLRRKVSEQLSAVVNRAVTVAIKDQPGIVRPSSGPRKPITFTVVVDVEPYTPGSARQAEAIS
ncbi:MAG TPA: hypothetical protein VGO73_06725 [Pyrinomonadaceae bacterium]|nr:hypothetical protein [Pyrinomonadaceae bacterium]